MRRTLRRRYPYFIAGLLIVVIIAILLIRRSAGAEDYGPALALCPGPDAYGYMCDSADGYAYIDATIDTRLYSDDGVTTLDLPFPFTFYGTTYTQVHASSNGNLQFNSENTAFSNACLDESPASGMGDMIAPYWDDLDLRFFGFLEYDTVGEAPNRIFVIEWDNIPSIGADESDRVTFEVQLFEGSNDIIFLYEDVQTLENSNGRSATIGLQSQTQGVALQYGCNVANVADGSGVAFPAPENPNNDYGMNAIIPLPTEILQTKGRLADALISLEKDGSSIGLQQLQTRWQTEQINSDWVQLDEQLLLLWHESHGTELALISPDEADNMTALYNHSFANRKTTPTHVTIEAVGDLTADNQTDAILTNATTGEAFLLQQGQPLTAIPQNCTGSIAILERNGRSLLARDNCAGKRLLQWWHDGEWHHIQ